MNLSRRSLITTATASVFWPHTAFARTARQITWDDLIPPGVPYSEIIGPGQVDEVNDTWLPVFDENAVKLNDALDGAYIRMPGYILPWDMTSEGVTSFILVPYVGACIHVPPPPANQLVFVTTDKPWASTDLWEAVWVTGEIRHEMQSTEVAEIGYYMTADEMEVFEWDENG